jgi:hypothetical protein
MKKTKKKRIDVKKMLIYGWYVAPLLFGIIGGTIGYLILRGKDKKMALYVLVFGLFMSSLGIFFVK